MYDANLVHAYAAELAAMPGLVANAAVLAAVAEIKRAAELEDAATRVVEFA